MIYTTLCYLEKDNKYLMLYRNKKQKDINNGKWIGLGGHIEANETKEECIKREVLEESGYTINSLVYCGEIHFFYNNIEEVTYLFKSFDFTGEEIECNEGILKWIDKDEILNLPLWSGDKIFLKLIQNEINNPFRLDLKYDESGNLINYKLS